MTEAEYLKTLVPILAFITRVGIIIQVYIAYQASFSNETIFPIAKRATSIGICNFTARLLCVFAPVAGELEKPEPALIMSSLAAFALVVSFTFQSKERE